MDYSPEHTAAIRELDARFAAGDLDLAEQAADLAAAREAVAAIKAILRSKFSPAVAGHICAALSEKVADASWSHTKESTDAQEVLDGLHDTLGAA